MTDTATTAEPPFYPPSIEAPEAALPIWKFLPTFIRNPLRALPAPVYHEPMFVPAQFGGRFCWITDPKLVEEVLLESHESFPKSPIEKRIFEPIIGDEIGRASCRERVCLAV